MLRIRCDDPTSVFILGEKFGVESNAEAERLLSIAKSLNLNVVGVSFHIGSGSKNYKIYKNAISAARDVFDIGAKLGYNFTFLDIGGGFPGKKNHNISEVNFRKCFVATLSLSILILLMLIHIKYRNIIIIISEGNSMYCRLRQIFIEFLN